MDIGGLNPATTYYFTCTSYCDALGWGSSYNISVRTVEKTPNDIFAPYTNFAFLAHSGHSDYDYKGIKMATGSKASTPYVIVTGSSSSYMHNYISMQFVQFVIVYQYGINVSHTPVSQGDLDILKTYKLKTLRKSGLTTIHDFGKINNAVLCDFSGSATNYHYYGIKFTASYSHRIDGINWTNMYVQFYK